jgi:DNA polymerase III gamma/tau subunit
MLKDIEDHQEAVFILSTTQPDKLDLALRKRCTLYQFKTPTAEQVVTNLQKVADAERLWVEPGSLEMIADRKQCVPRDCLGVLYDLSLHSSEITLAQVEGILVSEG